MFLVFKNLCNARNHAILHICSLRTLKVKCMRCYKMLNNFWNNTFVFTTSVMDEKSFLLAFKWCPGLKCQTICWLIIWYANDPINPNSNKFWILNLWSVQIWVMFMFYLCRGTKEIIFCSLRWLKKTYDLLLPQTLQIFTQLQIISKAIDSSLPELAGNTQYM